MPSERLEYLFARWLDRTASREEREELSELALMAANGDDLHELITQAWDKNFAQDQDRQIDQDRQDSYGLPDWDQMFRSIIGAPISSMLPSSTHSAAEQTELLKERIIPQTVIRRMPMRRLGWITAAASVVVFIGISLYFFISQKPSVKSTSAKKENTLSHISPGSNRATLTLGNGATMNLDSESVGTLAQQGNTKISKTDSGRLTYTLNNKSAVNPATIVENILTTPRGGQYQLVLPDGTKAWLNAASSITYPSAFTGTQRLVQITGEVYFEVVHNERMPFVVKTNNQFITDIGTSFNINAYPEEGGVATTLITGSVRIFTGTKTNILTPGMQELASVQGESVSIKNHVDIERVIAWRRGLFEFNETTLPVIMRQISRWYDIDIKYEGPFSQETFGGSINRNLPLSDVLKLLEANGVHFRLDNKTLFVSQNQNQK